MNKGKIYDKVSEKWFQVDGLTNKGIDDLKHIVINTGDLWAILDEAKKEWVDLDEYFEEERSEVARKWFKKWFGELK